MSHWSFPYFYFPCPIFSHFLLFSWAISHILWGNGITIRQQFFISFNHFSNFSKSVFFSFSFLTLSCAISLICSRFLSVFLCCRRVIPVWMQHLTLWAPMDFPRNWLKKRSESFSMWVCFCFSYAHCFLFLFFFWEAKTLMGSGFCVDCNMGFGLGLWWGCWMDLYWRIFLLTSPWLHSCTTGGKYLFLVFLYSWFFCRYYLIFWDFFRSIVWKTIYILDICLVEENK